MLPNPESRRPYPAGFSAMIDRSARPTYHF